MKFLFLTLFAFSALLPLVVECTHGPLSYEFSTSLHTKYNLYWNKPIDGEICMAVEVDTLGWVGLGFSPNGGMVDSDIMMAWVIDGQVTISDRFAVSQSLPVIDEQQDFELVEGYEEGGKTVIEFCRKVKTCHDRDRDILSGTTKVVYSWNNNDPNPTPLKHITRGFKNINIIGAKTGFSPSVTSNATIMDFTMGNVSIPNEASVYWCRTIRFIQPTEKKHVIKIGGVLDPRNTQYIYHILINVCPVTTLVLHRELPAICPSNCTSLFPHDIHIIGSFLHSRTSGAALWTQLIRDGKEIALLDVNLNYDHNFQEYLAQDAPITVKPGDELIFNCIFNTESRDEFTQGGPSINDEACINFLFYYPKMDTAYCLSSYRMESSFNAALDSFQCNSVDVNGSTTTDELVARARNIEWTAKISRTLEISQILDPNRHTAYCGGYVLNTFLVDIPKPGVDYEVFPNRYDTCGRYNGSYYPGGSTADYYYDCATNQSYFDPIGPTDSAPSLTLLPTVWLIAVLSLLIS